MRFQSEAVDGYRLYAVTGTGTVSFAVDASGADTRGLLGFAVERSDPAEDQRYYLPGFKLFESIIPQPDALTTVSTYDHPIQSFVYDDFTVKPGRRYEYWFHPLKGTPKNLNRNASPIRIAVATEPEFALEQEHDIVFNRGVAGSQAYARKFGNRKPDQLPPDKREEALRWLSRNLDDAILRFIAAAAEGDALLCCFYEFHYPPVAAALKAALARGVEVALIIDAKVNEYTDEKGVFHESFPREENLRCIAAAGLPDTIVILREARPGDIQHNKFMVLLKGADRKPVEVLTGSTNISVSGIHGQANVGHWIRNADVAHHFTRYWELLRTDPGGRAEDAPATKSQKNDTFLRAVEAIVDVPTKPEQILYGATPIFSPRHSDSVLAMYAQLVDQPSGLSCITFAFGINDTFKTLLRDNTERDGLVFILLERQDKPNIRSRKPFVRLDAGNNTYMAWGSYLREPLYQWTRETSARRLSISNHVSFVHLKFLLSNPLSDDPIIVTGSANFSKASTTSNDENMLIIRGDKRVADIYFTEFNRLFFHYYFRSMQEKTLSNDRQATREPEAGAGSGLFLAEDDGWLTKYRPNSLRWKRVRTFTTMQGITETLES